MITKAYAAGYKDGLAWDLDAYASWEDVERATTGWDDATLNAISTDEAKRLWGAAGVDDESPAWGRAMFDYNRGAYDGACQREGRSGLPPRGE